MNLRTPHYSLVLAILIPVASIYASPPGFSFQPTNRWIVPAGFDLAISMTVTGSPPLSYSWKVNGANLNSQTNDALALTNVQPSDAGTYMLVVTNLEGTNQSELVRLAITVANPVATPIALIGWNRDVVLENSATPFAQPFDAPLGQESLFEEEWKGHPDGLPSSRQFVSAINYPSALFELQPYNASNVLWLTAHPTTNSLTGTLTLVEPKPYVSISVVAASAFSAKTLSDPGAFGQLVLHFSDGTRSASINFLSLDWLVLLQSSIYDLMPIAGLGSCIGNVYLLGNQQALYQTDINLLTLGLATKTLTSITFTGSTAYGGTNQSTSIFAVSGVASDLGLSSPQILASNVTNQNSIGLGNLVLSVTADGTPPLTYEWKRSANSYVSATVISGATNATLITSNVPASYTLRVANPVGSLALGPAEINSYFGVLTNSYYYWSWRFYRAKNFRTMQSSNLMDWVVTGTFVNSLGFGTYEPLEDPMAFFRIVSP
ncbi:exported hypothetical protein [Verrucomicrobia bacterium]|nr:exported hypothetical protein [Verrucomicrobiota bacterium]